MKNPLAHLSPVFFVMLIAGVIVFGAIAVRMARTESVDAHVTYLDGSDTGGSRRAPHERARPQLNLGATDISVLYADRLRDATALSLALGLYILHERISNHHLLIGIGDVIDGINHSDLMPPQMQAATSSGIFSSPRGLYYVRYRSSPLTIEVLACGSRGLEDGAIFIIRLPEAQPIPVADLAPSEQAGGFATLFTAPFANAVIPQPFSSAQVFAAAGWAQEPLRATPFSSQQVTELNQWLAAYNNAQK